MGTYLNNTIEGGPLTVAQLAISHPQALAIFTKYNIDYCCGGHRSLDEACARVGLDPTLIRTEIFRSVGTTTSQDLRPESWTSSFLIDFIVQNHHGFVRRAIPELQAFLDKVCDAHGNECLESLQIREHFFDLAEDLTSHMEKEEIVLFPAIKRLERHDDENHPLIVTIQAPIGAMEHDHVVAGDLIKQIRLLSDNYTPPEFACPTFKITYKKLQEFDNDLMRHIHLENNILFQRVKDRKPASGSCAL